MVTVGYEWVRGLRAINKRADGFAINKIRAVGVPVSHLFEAWNEALMSLCDALSAGFENERRRFHCSCGRIKAGRRFNAYSGDFRRTCGLFSGDDPG